jgi:molybdopterin synthase catalytic subunit
MPIARHPFISELVNFRAVGFLGTVGLHSRGEVNLEQVVREIRKHPDSARAGAFVTFAGIVREDPVEHSAGRVQCLEYEAFEEVAIQKLQELRDDLAKREGIVDVSIHHVVDRLQVGEESLIVAVLGTHRRFVFPVLEEAVERVKKEIPIWKKEFTSDDAYWVSDAGHDDSESRG